MLEGNVHHVPLAPAKEKESFGSFTVLTSEENGASPASDDDSSQRRLSAPSGTVARAVPVEGTVQRRSSEPIPEGAKEKKKRKKKKPQRRPKAKLTFVNGQFVDPSTPEGRGIVAAAGSGDASAAAVGGVLHTVPAGHCGLLASQRSQEKGAEDTARENSGEGATNKGGGGGLAASFSKGMARLTSDSSASAGQSASTRGAGEGSGPNDAVSCIAVLGEGRFLTSSKSDRAVKLWKAGEDEAGGPVVELVRDFAGHGTGVTCLATVDPKGRFLSASKDRTIKLWDSRFNCDDGEEAEEQRYLLATFGNMDRRSIHGIAITETGQFVRPTDQVDTAMAAAMVKKAMKEGSAAVTKAAQERQVSGLVRRRGDEDPGGQSPQGVPSRCNSDRRRHGAPGRATLMAPCPCFELHSFDSDYCHPGTSPPREAETRREMFCAQSPLRTKP